MEMLLNIFGAGELGKWSSYFKRAFLITLGVTSLLIALRGLLAGILSLSTTQILASIVLAYAVPHILNTIIFIIYRHSSLGIRFSHKTNLVFAYNLEGINQEKFLKKYNELIAEIKNEIDSKELGEKVRIIVAPSDVRLRDKTAAEAKVLLGLRGSTVLVWGYARRENGKVKFVTRFSYEFAYPKNVPNDQAKSQMHQYIDSLMARGLFSGVKMDTSHFREQIIPSVFFILGLTTFTLRLLNQAEQYLLAFKKTYRESDIVRKRDLGPALMECHRMLVAIYGTKMPHVSSELGERGLEQAEALAMKILEIDPNSYYANIVLAYIYDLKGNKSLAHEHSDKAEKHASREDSAHLFNAAYFALDKGDYPKAIGIYEQISEVTEVVTGDVSSYLNKRYLSTLNPAYMFGDGYVAYHWNDRESGLKTLKSFRSKADPVEHKVLLDKLDELGIASA
jgi:tetratricopeptide (TPR) repeat protein